MGIEAGRTEHEGAGGDNGFDHGSMVAEFHALMALQVTVHS